MCSRRRPRQPPSRHSGCVRVRAELFTLSARDARALTALAARHAHALATRGDDELAAVCFTANHGRAHFAFRATLRVRSMAELVGGLQALAGDRTHACLRTAHAARRDPPRVACSSPGRARSTPAWCVACTRPPAFRDALDRCAAGLAPHLERLLELLFPADGEVSKLDETGNTNPCSSAVEYALALASGVPGA